MTMLPSGGKTEIPLFPQVLNLSHTEKLLFHNSIEHYSFQWINNSWAQSITLTTNFMELVIPSWRNYCSDRTLKMVKLNKSSLIFNKNSTQETKVATELKFTTSLTKLLSDSKESTEKTEISRWETTNSHNFWTNRLHGLTMQELSSWKTKVESPKLREWKEKTHKLL